LPVAEKLKMSGRRSVRKIKTRKALRSVGAALLLFCYLAGNASFGILHRLLHQQQTTVSHSPAQERDVCHRAIYHFGKDPKHNAHFAISEKSDRCLLLAHAEQILIADPTSERAIPHGDQPQTCIALQFSGTSILLPSRAPPAS
jgi:hypothetical protein